MRHWIVRAVAALIAPVALASCASRGTEFTMNLAPEFEERRNERPRESVAIGLASRTIFRRDTTIPRPWRGQRIAMTFMLKNQKCWSLMADTAALHLLNADGERIQDVSLFLQLATEADIVAPKVGAVMNTEAARRALALPGAGNASVCTAQKLDTLTRAEVNAYGRKVFGAAFDSIVRVGAVPHLRPFLEPLDSLKSSEKANWILFSYRDETQSVFTPKSRTVSIRKLPSLSQVNSVFSEVQRRDMLLLDAQTRRVQSINLDLVCVSRSERDCFEPGKEYRLAIITERPDEGDPSEFQFRVVRSNRAIAGLTGLLLTIGFLGFSVL